MKNLLNSLLIATTAIAASASPAAAAAPAAPQQQQQYYTSPRGHLQTEGNNHAIYFGSYASARYQVFDAEQRGHTMVLKEVSYRLDDHIYSNTSGMGRRWSSVTLRVSDCDMSKLSQTFAQNPIGKQTLTFRGAVDWPTVSGRPKTQPASWGGTNDEYRFPFTTKWLYAGHRDLCLDYDFSGGSLHNQAPWPTSKMLSYRLDGYSNVTHAQNTQTFLGKGSTQGGCIDGSQTSGAYTLLNANSYGPTYQIARLRDKHEIYSRSYHTAPSKPVVHVLGFAGHAHGRNIAGVSCNPLYVDLTKPSIYFMRVAGKAGNGYTYNDIGLFPYNSAAAGLPLWLQAGWDDSNTGQLRVSRAVQTAVPALPKLVLRRMLFQNDPAKKAGTGFGPVDYASHNPMVRYGQ